MLSIQKLSFQLGFKKWYHHTLGIQNSKSQQESLIHSKPKDHPDTDLKELVRNGRDEVISESKSFYRGEEAGVMVLGVREMMQGLKAIGREIQWHK